MFSAPSLISQRPTTPDCSASGMPSPLPSTDCPSGEVMTSLNPSPSSSLVCVLVARGERSAGVGSGVGCGSGVGVGEGVDDLVPFDLDVYLNGLISKEVSGE